MAGDYGKFKVGNIVYPLNPTLASNPLLALNPAIYYALDYFATMLQVHQGDMWNAVMTNINKPQFINKVVNYQLPYDPKPYFTEEQAKFPLLAIWQTEVTPEERTFSWYHNKEIWKVCYSLFPVTPAEAESVYPFVRSAFNIIRDRAEQGYDPNYQSSLQVWSDGYGGIEKMTTFNQKTVFQNLTFDPRSNLIFPTVLITMEVTFREAFQRDFLSELDGIDTTQLLDGYQFLQTKQDF